VPPSIKSVSAGLPQDRGAGQELKDCPCAEQGCAQFFLPGVFSDSRSGRVELLPGWEEMSGKFALVANMLAVLYAETDDRVVIVSNYTQVLHLATPPNVLWFALWLLCCMSSCALQ